jgi:hypothetical protein
VQIAALDSGAGIGASHVQLAQCRPDLVCVLRKEFKFKREMWLAVHRDARATCRTRLVFDHLAVGLARYVKEAI